MSAVLKQGACQHLDIFSWDIIDVQLPHLINKWVWQPLCQLVACHGQLHHRAGAQPHDFEKQTIFSARFCLNWISKELAWHPQVVLVIIIPLHLFIPLCHLIHIHLAPLVQKIHCLIGLDCIPFDFKWAETSFIHFVSGACFLATEVSITCNFHASDKGWTHLSSTFLALSGSVGL